jgi:ribosome biogenesis GTPase / thiamine phosphate phosphatase
VLFLFQPTEEFIKGTIFKIESKDYYALDDQKKEVRCSLRGKFQKEYSLKKDKLYAVDIVCVGDRIEFDLNQDNSGVITKVFPRENYISRKAPRIKGAGVRGQRLEQIVAANIDNLIIVSSAQTPKFNNRLIDRLIVASESSGIQPIIVINKIDLDKGNEIVPWADLYREIGYEVFETSVIENRGIDKLKLALQNKKNLVWGQSGVGKSSLLNILYSELDFKVGAVSNYSSKGTHTTVTSVMKNVGGDTFIIDTPGIREIDPYGIKQEDLGHYFIEFGKYISDCRFNTCTHNHEPGCAVCHALNSGDISAERYQSYLNILETIEEDLYL